MIFLGQVAGILSLIVGAIVILKVAVFPVIGWVLHWLRLHLFRRSPLRRIGIINVSNVVDYYKQMAAITKDDWDLKLWALQGRRIGIGFFFLSPPVYKCEFCDKTATTLNAILGHARWSHADNPEAVADYNRHHGFEPVKVPDA